MKAETLYARRVDHFFELRGRLFERRGITREGCLRRMPEIYALLAGFSEKQIQEGGLDNPLLSEDARKCLISETIRFRRARMKQHDPSREAV